MPVSAAARRSPRASIGSRDRAGPWVATIRNRSCGPYTADGPHPARSRSRARSVCTAH